MRTAALLLVLFAARAVNAGEPAAIVSEAELKSSLKKHRGRIVVLHLWATWCEACVEELPLVGKLAREAKTRGIDIVSVSLDDPSAGGAEKVSRMIDQRGGEAMSRTIVRIPDPDAFVAGIDPKWEGSIPAFFGYDRKGKLRRSLVGELTRPAFDQLVGGLQ